MSKAGTKTNERILDAAVMVFAKKGYNAASTKEIAAEAGVSEGCVFKYYKTKRDILLTATDKVIKLMTDDKTMKPFEKIIAANINAPPAVVLKEIILDRAAIFHENSELAKIIITEALYSEEIMGKFLKAAMETALPVLYRFLEHGIGEGVFRSFDELGKRVALRSFIAMTAGYVLQRALAPDIVDAGGEDDLEIMLDIYLKGIAK